MERTIIVKEANELRVYLNRANKLKDTMTELAFKISQIGISEYGFFAISKNNSEIHKIIIASRGKTKHWEALGYTKFKNLENYIEFELNKLEQSLFESNRPFKLSDEQIFRLESEVICNIKNSLIKI